LPRYFVTMKKTPRKLSLRSDVIRALTGVELSRAVGALETVALAAFDTGDKACDVQRADVVSILKL